MWAGASFAQFQIVAVSPATDDLHAEAFAPIRVQFNLPLNTAALPTNAIQVWGNYHGRYNGTLNYDAATTTLMFTPLRSFVDGEEITVVVSAAISASTGSTLAQSFTYRFLVRTTIGTGTFLPITINLEDLAGGGGISQEPTHLVAADFDNDNFIDLAVVHRGTNRVTILRNNARGASGQTLFTLGSILSTDNTPTHAAAANFNGDDRLDLAVVNFNSNSFQIFFGNGNGQFLPPQNYATDEHPIHLLAQDFNGDGAVDVAVVAFGVDRVNLFLNDGTGNFNQSLPQRSTVGASPITAAAWDYDQNGSLDLVVANNGSKSLSLLRNDGRGTFAYAQTMYLPQSPVDLTTGDVIGTAGNRVGDARRELLVLCSDLHLLGKTASPQASARATSLLAVISGNVNGLNLIETTPLAGYAQAFALCNVDTLDTQRGVSPFQPDRDLDLFYTRFWDSRVSWRRNSDNQSFTIAAAADLDSVAGAKAITSLDLDRDGDNDLVVSNLLQNQLVIYLNEGSRVPLCTPRDSLGTSVAVLNFGEVWVRRTATQRIFITNSSALDFSFTTLLSDSVQFHVTPRQGSSPAGQSVPLNVIFTPSDTGVYRGNLFISIDDPLAPEACSVILLGRGVRATIVADSLLDFGCTAPGTTVTRVLRIANTGNIPLGLASAETSPPFSVQQNVTNLQIAPGRFTEIPIGFTPTRVGVFLDSLKIRSNDLDHPVATVYLRGCGSGNGPTITSPDTLFATEDVLAVYVATATDPDNTTPTFRFENLPHWLQAFNETVRGTPREGDLDTSFTVIASDGAFEDTLRVIVVVTPVNDPPFFDPIADRTIYERDLLIFEVVARDPEDSTIVVSAQNLPEGATFTNLANNRGRFNWRPELGAAGEYVVTFIVREQIAVSPLSATATVRITVLQRLPDLYLTTFSLSNPSPRLNETVTLAAALADSSLPVSRSFTAAVYLDNQILADTVITAMNVGQILRWARPMQFTSVGRHNLRAVVDSNNDVAELNETNNEKSLAIEVQSGPLRVAPNPFTPNADGFNDVAVFDFREMAVQSPQLKIFDLKGNLLMTFSQPQSSEFRWNGSDQSGRPQPPGPYLYLLLDGDKKMATGYVVLVR
ncbi:MAG: FG-GAP-like repeat-containing protein [candidate division KSB1 bacterium]|nr:FG-GAP-like repeat-containing protein [candidate division KSB1 bacterium]